MKGRVDLACESRIVTIPVGELLPVKRLTTAMMKSRKYQCIASSVAEIGVIEPLVVFAQRNEAHGYLLLDGHMRLQIVKSLGWETVECLLAGDDEAFTYNHKVNRLSTIQEHFMIRRAIKQGVSEERIAQSLNVDTASIRKKRDLLEGVCPEAVELLKEKRISAKAIREIRKAKPIRQIEMAELMIASWNFSTSYAKCLLAATPPEQLIESEQQKEIKGLSADDIARIEREMEGLERDFKAIEDSYGKNVLNLVIVVGYLRNLLANVRVVRYLSRNHPEILSEFQKLIKARNLNEEANESL